MAIVLQGLWTFSLVRGDHRTAHELGQQLLRLTRRVEDPVLLLLVSQALGTTLCFLGEFAAAQDQFEQSIVLYDPQRHRVLAFRYAEDPGVTCLTISAWVLWFRGYPDQAKVRAQESLTLARKLEQPFSLVLALFCCTFLSHQCDRQDCSATRQWIDEAMVLAGEQGFPFWSAWGQIIHGMMLARGGQGEAGLNRCSREWLLLRRQGQGYCGRISWRCWPRHTVG